MTTLTPLLIVVLIQAGFIVTPGPDFALILETVGEKGRSMGVTTALGIGAGCFALLVLSILGLNTLLAAFPVLNTIIRYVGAAWLLWQAVISFLPHPPRKRKNKKRAWPFLHGFLNHALNIEVVLFYVAVISQVSSQHVAQGLQFLAALEMALFTVMWFTFVAYIAGKIPNNQRILNHVVVRVIISILFLLSAIGLIKTGYLL